MAAKAGTDGSTGDTDPAAQAGTTTPADPGLVPAADGTSVAGLTPEAGGTLPLADVKAPAPQDAPPAAAPLTAPVKKAGTRADVPVPAEANAAVTQAPGDDEGAIVGHDGEPISPDGLFTESAPHHTFLEAAQDIFRKFRYPGQHAESPHQHSMQLVARAGTQIPRDKAHELIEAARNGGISAAGGAGAGAGATPAA